jgi:hypothetical protein
MEEIHNSIDPLLQLLLDLAESDEAKEIIVKLFERTPSDEIIDQLLTLKNDKLPL